MKNSTDQLPEEELVLVRHLHDANRFSFSFGGKLESRFKHHLLTKYSKQNRLYPLLGSVGLLLFIIADWIVIPQIAAEVTILRVLSAAFVLAFVWIAHKPSFFKWIQAGLATGSLLIHIVITGVGVAAAHLGELHYQFGSIITMFFLCSALRIKFSYVLPFATLMLGIQYYSVYYLMALDFSQLTENIFIFTFVTIISLLLSATIEHEIRSNFLQQILLHAEQADLIKTQEKLRQLSISDALTQLYNRRYFNHFLDREWQSALRHQHSIAVIMIDIDDFKTYNDTHGHLKGDDILVLIAKTLRSTLHRPDDMIARYGGEEFVAVLPSSDLKAGTKVSESMREAIESLHIPHPTSKSGKWVTISLGVSACIPDPLQSSQFLIKTADEALYQSKHSGKNTVTSKVIKNSSNI